MTVETSLASPLASSTPLQSIWLRARTWFQRAEAEDSGSFSKDGARLSALLDVVPDPVAVVDADDHIQAVNHAMEAVLGHEVLIGRPAAETLVSPPHREVYRSRLRQSVERGADVSESWDRVQVIRADGTAVAADLSVRPIPDADRDLFVVCLRTGGVSAATDADTSALEVSETRRRTLHTILDAIPDSVVAVNGAGRVVFRNRASAQDLTSDRPQGRAVGEGSRAVHGLSDAWWREAKTVMRRGEPTFGQEEPGVDGGIRLTTRIPVRNEAGAVGGLVVVSRDVTSQKADEARLLDAKRAAEAAARANNEFLATTSHEVRTLMSGVTGMTTLLLDTHLDDEQRDFVSTIRTSSDALLRIVHDVLDLSKIDAGMFELEERPFDVRRVVKDALGMVSQQGAAKGLDLLSDVSDRVPETVSGDAVRLQQVIVNLLTNAIKFTDEGSVRVRVGLAPPTPEGGLALTFAVEDTGVGIEPERLEAVFERFVQADASTARTRGGTGLGLTICRRLVTMMGGEMSAESVPGGGSVFRFTVVLRTHPDEEAGTAASPAPAAPAPSPEPPPKLTLAESTETDPPAATPRAPRTTVMEMDSILPSARVLLVEDDPVMQKVTTLTLQRLGYRPSVVGDGAKAVMAVRSRPFDIVLMDIMMPVMDGFEATRQIRAEPGPHPPPAIVALTANAMEGDRERCLDAGADDYLSKPVAPRHLAATIERAIRSRAETPGDV